MRRLLKQSIEGVESTDGINIDVANCKIRLRDGKWVYKRKLLYEIFKEKLKKTRKKEKYSAIRNLQHQTKISLSFFTFKVFALVGAYKYVQTLI